MASTQQQVSRMQAELADLRHQIAAYGEVLRGDASATGEHAWSRVRAAGEEARLRAREAGLYAREQAEHATEATRGQISSHPLTSVGAAFAVGVVLGALLGRR